MGKSIRQLAAEHCGGGDPMIRTNDPVMALEFCAQATRRSEMAEWTVRVEWPAEPAVSREFDDRYAAWSYYHQWAGAYGPERVLLLSGEDLACSLDWRGTQYGPALLRSLGR